MECRIRARVEATVEELARGHQQDLAAAGALGDFEESTSQIGDESARQSCENELTSRAGRAPEQEQCVCPKCGLLCPRGQPERVVLQGLRGEVAFLPVELLSPTLSPLFFSGSSGGSVR
jgi:hypothetical protein